MIKNPKTYGRLTVISEIFRRNGNGTHSYVKVRCICGVEKEARLDLLNIGKIKSCGCLAKEIEKELKRRYGRLTVISEPYRRSDLAGRAMYVDVLCDCGINKSVKAISLKNGATKSCGCMIAEATRKAHTTHGLSKHRLMKIWSGMIQRCTNVKSESYPNYGGRGVKICKKWLNSFFDFYKWAIENGWQQGLELDKDTKGNGLLYSPKTCCFITQKENARAKRTVKLTMKDAETIRLLYSTGKHTFQSLADMYNICNSGISGIVHYENWS